MNIFLGLNIPKLWIWQSSECHNMAEYICIYDKRQVSEYDIVLNMSHTRQREVTTSSWVLKRQFWICVGFKYARVVNIPGLSICQGSEFPGLHSVYLIFVNMTAFWICVEMQLCKGSENFRISNMPDVCICKRYTMFSICLNMAK